ncbi:MAG: hypothetical protein J6Q94_04735 [Clostridia bacterium]|nr:hypothetical protein [Clostridia bacterium]
MSNAPVKKGHKIKTLNDLMNSNKFVLFLSLVIAFLIWVAVAMYASPEESYTIYNVPITVNTENSLVAQKGYKNFWQSSEKIDVTVTGPRYLITSLTPDDILVSANLNTVDSAGVSQLALKVSLKENSQDITISAQSKTYVDIYFDTELEKKFDIQLDPTLISEKIADGYQLNSADLTVSSVTIKGPETEMNKIVNVIADPNYPEDLLFETITLPVALSLEGANASETVSVNKYVEIVDSQEFFVKINIDKIAELIPEVVFTGEKTGETNVSFSIDTIPAKIDTGSGYDKETIPVLTVDYSELSEGVNVYYVESSEIELPDGIDISESIFTFNIKITFSPADAEN